MGDHSGHPMGGNSPGRKASGKKYGKYQRPAETKGPKRVSKRRNKGSAGQSLGAGPNRTYPRQAEKNGCAIVAIGALGMLGGVAWAIFEGAKAVLS